jgi:hypothetical protein
MAFLKPQQVITINTKCSNEQAALLKSNLDVLLDKLSIEEIDLMAKFIHQMSPLQKIGLLSELRKNVKQ